MAVSARPYRCDAVFEFRLPSGLLADGLRAAGRAGVSLSEWSRAAWEAQLVVQRAEELERRDRDVLLGAAYPQRGR